MLRNLILLLVTGMITGNSLYAQTKDVYTKQWKKVDAFEKRGLIKNALQEVMAVYNLALKNNDDAQQIKACIYQVKYLNMEEENSHEKNIFFTDTLIAKAKSPAKNILQSMQAEMLWQYLQNNRWKFYDRTKLDEEKSNDISTWSLDKLHGIISGLYKASLNNETILKTTRLEKYDPILVKGENTRQLRPTLFDFLAHRALSYFMNDEADLTKPAYQFIINDEKVFAPAPVFIVTSFKTKDSTSLQYHALLILQNILKFHLNDNKPDALIDADITRLNFVNQYAVNDNKEKLYEAALKAIEETYPANPSSAQAIYLRAQMYYNKGQDFDPLTKTDNQYELKRARETCETAIAKFPASEGAVSCQNLLNLIQQPFINLQTEKVNVPNQPFRTLVQYRNTKTIYLRIVKTSREELKNITKKEYSIQFKELASLPAIKNWNIALPDLQDHQEHATEIKVDGLTNGNYILLASIDKDFSLTRNIISRQTIYISNISYISNNKKEYYVLNRDNGQPLPNTQVQIWETKYNYSKSEYEQVKAEKYIADKNGIFKLKETKEYRNFLLQFTTNNDQLFLDNAQYDNVYNSYETPEKPVAFLFTDRSIYRPGQIIYFKGIVLKKGNTILATTILPAFKSHILLKDANGQKINELNLTTNDFGSYNGSFKLPEGTLNGNFSLYDETTGTTNYFNVEEYKRPKFFVDIPKPPGTYRLNDSIKVTGNAKAYAGNLIDNAKVKYRVTRKVRYPEWWGWGGYIRKGRGIYPPGRSDEMEITNGESITNEKGEFNISFKAIPDATVDKKGQPVFYYEINADITDLNGETRTGNTSVTVAYQALQLNINLPEKMLADSFNSLKIRSSNLNDIFEKANINVTISKVQSPNRLFRERYWNMPDQYIMSKDEYYGYFPYDIYKDEDQVKNWPLADKVIDRTDSTVENSKFILLTSGQNSKFEAGWYKVIATTKDKYGENVKDEKFIRLTDAGGQTKGIKEAVTFNVIKGSAEPGEKITYNIATGFDNTWLIHTLSKAGNINTSTFQAIKSAQPYQSSIIVTEEDRGGLAASYVFVQHNRIYKGFEIFNIPWSNKDLAISYETFRDKLLPGSEEKWKIKITGNKGEKIAAEMLAGMYDASLDQFKPHNWNTLDIWPKLNYNMIWNKIGFEATESEKYDNPQQGYVEGQPKSYDRLLLDFDEGYNYFRGGKNMQLNYMKAASPVEALEGRVAGIVVDSNGAPGPATKITIRGIGDIDAASNPLYEIDGVVMDKPENIIPGEILSMIVLKGADAIAKYGAKGANGVIIITTKSGKGFTKLSNTDDIKARKNFNETAFFFPDLKTDETGNVAFSFTIPEALTQWKLMTLAHTKDLASGYAEKTVVTQKTLMVQPNAPRFIREGDKMEFSAKIVNLSDSQLTGIAQLTLSDAATNKTVDVTFKNNLPSQPFTVAAGQSVAVKFPIDIPLNFNSALTYRIIAKATSFSDGEEMAIPVLTNRMLVTESMPLNLRNTNKKDFRFEKLLNSGNSRTISNYALTVEYSSNPAWYAVQALPYLMEYPYECAEQTFNRYYANILASYISNNIPKIKTVFEKWGNTDTAALLSNLQKNEELKSVLLQETPWVIDAQNETQQKKNIALLFDMVRMSTEANKTLDKLKEMQSPNGGFVWFKGGPDDRYITQYIITGIGHLKKLNALSGTGSKNFKDIKSIIDKAIPYLDKKIKEDYDYLIKSKVNLKNNNLGYTAIQYLYMRNFFTEYNIPFTSQKAYNYYMQQAGTYWLQQSKYMQAMIALALNRSILSNTADKKIINTPKQIIASLKQTSIVKEEMGMYWKEWTTGGYYWHQAPIESQAIMIEAFTDIDKNTTIVDDLKTWLLKQKQTQNWKTTKATAEACYALLLGGSDWLAAEKKVDIKLGNTTISSNEETSEAGTGYFKKKIDGDKVDPAMGNITVNITAAPNNTSTSWGSVYWQYFEALDKITPAATPLQLNKKLFIETNSDRGPVLKEVKDGSSLKVGDKVKVRIELRVDRDMEYVHMKDMRASCMEPINVISQYKWQGGLGYYESTKDASTNFFFGWLARGTYVFEYSLFVTHSGNFSNGITSIQCMYAPEFTSHSEGIRVTVTE